MADATTGLPTLVPPQPAYVPRATDPNFALLTQGMMRTQANQSAMAALTPPAAPQAAPVDPTIAANSRFNAANAAADQQLVQAFTPGPAAVAVPQPSNAGAGFVSRLPNAPILPAAAPAPSQFVPRYAGNAPGTSQGFGVGHPYPTFDPSIQPAAPGSATPAAPAMNLANPDRMATDATRITTSLASPSADASGPVLNPRFAGPGPVTAAMFANPQGPAAGASAALAAAPVYAGGNAVPVNGVGGMVGGFRDPSGAINDGFSRQQSTAQDYMTQALNYIQGGGDIFERATRGRAIAGILHAVVGPNNQGQVQGQGADALNQSIAGVSSAGIGANANMYGSDQALRANEERIAGSQWERQYTTQHTPVQVGASPYSDPLTKMTIPLPTFGLPTGRTNPDGTVGYKALSPNRAIPEQAGVENQIRTRASGAQEVFTNGQWVPQK